MPSARPPIWTQGRSTLLLIAAVLAAAAIVETRTPLTRGVQRWLHDRAVSGARPVTDSSVAVILIDAASQARHGPLPWRRDLHARLIDRLGRARVIVDTEGLTGRESEQALAELQNIHAAIASDPVLSRHPELPALLERSEASLDGDGRLAQSLEHSGRTLLALAAPGDAAAPLASLAEAAAGVGHAVPGADDDGVLRSHPLLRTGADGRPVASIAALAAGLHRGRSAAQVLADLQACPPLMAGQPLPADAQGQLAALWPRHDGQLGSPLVVSAREVLAGDAAVLARLDGRIVVIGREEPTEPRWRLPSGRDIGMPEAIARLSATFVQDRWITTPPAARWLPWLLLAAAGLYLARVLPRLTRSSALMLTSSLCLALALASHLLLAWGGMWIAPTLPILALGGGHLALSLADRWQRARRRRHVPVLPPSAAMADTVITTFEAEAVAADSHHDSRHDTQIDTQADPATISEAPDTVVMLEDSTQPPATPADEAAFPKTQPLLRPETLRAQPPAPAPVAVPPPAPVPAPPVDPALEATQPLTREELAACLSAPPVFREPPLLSERVRTLPRLGPYQLERELGRGAMGRIYLARHHDSGQEVALKTLALAREFDGVALQEARQRFHREARAARRLSHQDIVQVIDVGEQNGVAFIAMERLTGHDLSHHLLHDRLLPVRTVVTIATRIARALAHAHAQGVIHRDIKPANIMVDLSRDQVKVTDFGIARIVDSNRSHTRTGLVLGSPSYMSPEQLAGRELDGRSDLYALGVLMFQMLTGDLPLSGHTMSELIGAIARTPAPDVRTLRPSLPESLAEVIGILLEKRPELRYRDGNDLAADLQVVASQLRPRLQPPRPARTEPGSVQECAPGPSRDRVRSAPPPPAAAQSRR